MSNNLTTQGGLSKNLTRYHALIADTTMSEKLAYSEPMQNSRKRLDPLTIPEISRRMRLLRRTTGLNQTDFAKKVGVARNVWANVEGEFSRIGVDTALKLCDVFLVTLDWVYRGDDQLIPHGLAVRLKEAEEAEDAEAPQEESPKRA